MTSGSLWNYYGDELINSAIEIKNNGNNINSNKKATNKFFKNKTKLIGSMPKNINILDTEVVVPLKYLCNFWRSLDLPLINCEIELDLRQAKNQVICEISIIFRAFGDLPEQEVETTTAAAIFQINKAKIYVPVITL